MQFGKTKARFAMEAGNRRQNFDSTSPAWKKPRKTSKKLAPF